MVCSAVFSLTDFPLELEPKKKLYGLLQKLFFGLAREGKSLDRKGIFMTHLLKMGIKKAPVKQVLLVSILFFFDLKFNLEAFQTVPAFVDFHHSTANMGIISN